jgi:hypothetical protein
MPQNLVKGVKRVTLPQVIASKAKINFKKCPVAPLQFDILNLRELEKRNLSKKARFRARLPLFVGTLWRESVISGN